MGYKLAGFDVIAANDIDPEMATYYKQNLDPHHYFLEPIAEFTARVIRKEVPAELYNLDILDGSPPCSSFSTAGSRDRDWGKEKFFREGQTAQVLDDLFFDYLDLVAALRPKISIAENVKGMLVGLAKGYVKLIIQRYRALGYRVQLFLLNSADCGVAQRRERVFFVAVREDLIEHYAPLKLDPKFPWITAGDAVRSASPFDTEEASELSLTEHFHRVWNLTAPGEFLAAAIVRTGKPPALWSWRKFHSQLPGYTLTATDCSLHWSEPRRLSFAERVRIGSFPDDYVVKSKKLGRYLIGMSVPPRMMQFVAEAVRDQWLMSSANPT